MVINSRPYRYRVEDIKAVYELMNNGQQKERKYKMFKTNDPTRDLINYEIEMVGREKEYQDSIATCCECQETLYNPYWNIWGDYFCDECVKRFRVCSEPPINGGKCNEE